MTVPMSDLDSIWDDDAVVTRRPQAQSEQEPLFLPEEEEVPQIDIDVDKIFSSVDTDEFRLEPLQRIDIEAEKRAAEKRRKREEALSLRTHEVLPSSSPPRDTGDVKDKAKDNDGDKKKERRRIPVLDEGRLIGDDGFPRLIKDTKYFRIKGKGHEVTDLHRLLQIYQYWTHRLYPRTQFKDTVERVEKLCHSRRMQSRLSTWRDEALGKKPSLQVDEDVIDLTENQPESESRLSSAPPTRPPSSMSEGDNNNRDDDPFDTISRNPTARRVVDDDDDDDFMFGAFENSAVETAPVSNETTPAALDDEEMWSMVEELERETPSTTKTSDPTQTDEDEDMWNVLSELEAEAEAMKKNTATSATSTATTSTSTGQQTDHQPTAARSFVEEDVDDMYL